MRNEINDLSLTLNQSGLNEAKYKVLDLIVERVPEIEFVRIQGGYAFQIGDGQYAVMGATYKKTFDIEEEVANYQLKLQQAREKTLNAKNKKK